ncbi:lysozyme [Vibrio quintilis]|uniref:Lysozyme n=1 Tax=Vibrio quintilis TaxID=1117707 RepID=A0A1M7YZB0_9VIBR|nr:lysozyme [Vibrio quintilis]SHO57892.1 Lysozyme RrrD [Vibrio quintilis]
MKIRLNKSVCSVAAVIAIVTGGASIHSTESVGKVQIEAFSGELRISPAGLAIIGNAEGCRTHPYHCPAGLLTNGIGNTHDVPKTDVSLERIATDWVKNIHAAELCISSAESVSGVRMTPGQFDAFTSFAFNTGCPRFMRNHNGSATGIYSNIMAGNYPAACNELKRWVYAGGKKLPGLIDRRGREYARCTEVD